MTMDTKQFECEQLTKVVQEYRDKGYLVVVNPSPSDLPSFLASFQPDLVARNMQQNFVVEVETQSSLRDNLSEIQRLSQTVQSQMGWHFVLALRNPPSVELLLSSNGLPSAVKIIHRISEMEKLLESNHLDEALLVIWPVVEAVLRQLTIQNGINSQENRIAYILEDLTFLGAIEQEDYNVLWRAIEAKQAVGQNDQHKANYIRDLQRLPSTLRNLIAQDGQIAVAS